ncbi:TPA: hypothetical protein ACK4UE_002144, partial [Neisseria gonorrhoeae]
MLRIRGAAALWGHPLALIANPPPRASRLFAASPAKCGTSPALAQGTEARRYFACLWLKLL